MNDTANMIVRKDWADSLNLPNPNASSTLLADLMDPTVLQELQATEVNGISWDSRPCWPADSQSIVLSAVIADGLGRIASEYSVDENLLICRKGWCSIGPWSATRNGNPVIYNGTYSEFEALRWWYIRGEHILQGYETTGALSDQIMHSFPQPPDYREQWTEVSFKNNRYGYGWGFKSKLVKAAAAIMINPAANILAHSCNLIISGEYYCFIDTVGELVALALKSQTPTALKDTSSTGTLSNSLCSQPTAVRLAAGTREYEQELEIVVGLECKEGKGNVTFRQKQIPYEGT